MCGLCDDDQLEYELEREKELELIGHFEGIKDRLDSIEEVLRAVIVDIMKGSKLSNDEWMALYNTLANKRA